MPPEVLLQQGHTRFADIWSLGCTVYELFVGKPPWFDQGQKNPITTFFVIMNATQPPALPNHISPVLRDFIENCLKRNPNERANVYELLRHPFIKLYENEQKATITPPPPIIRPIASNIIVTKNYTATMDRIEEEATPVPSNSEYSRNHREKSST